MPYLLHMMVYHKVKQPPGLLAQRQYFSFEFLNSSLKGMKQKQSEDTAVLDMSIQFKYLRDDFFYSSLTSQQAPLYQLISIWHQIWIKILSSCCLTSFQGQFRQQFLPVVIGWKYKVNTHTEIGLMYMQAKVFDIRFRLNQWQGLD